MSKLTFKKSDSIDIYDDMKANSSQMLKKALKNLKQAKKAEKKKLKEGYGYVRIDSHTLVLRKIR